MWRARRDWELSVALALLCHAVLLYGFQIAMRPLATPEPQKLIEMALVPPPGDAKAGGAGRAPIDVPRVATPSPPPRAAEIRPPHRTPPSVPPKPTRAPAPVPAEVPAPMEAPPRSESQAAAEAPAPAASAALKPEPGAPAGGGGGDAAGRSSEAGSGSGTEHGTPGVRASPRYRTNPAPTYPPLARARRQEGLVLLRVSVTADGRAARVELAKSSGFGNLDEAALEAVRDWDFEPARIGLRAVASEIQVPVRFQLAD